MHCGLAGEGAAVDADVVGGSPSPTLPRAARKGGGPELPSSAVFAKPLAQQPFDTAGHVCAVPLVAADEWMTEPGHHSARLALNLFMRHIAAPDCIAFGGHAFVYFKFAQVKAIPKHEAEHCLRGAPGIAGECFEAALLRRCKRQGSHAACTRQNRFLKAFALVIHYRRAVVATVILRPAALSTAVSVESLGLPFGERAR